MAAIKISSVIVGGLYLGNAGAEDAACEDAAYVYEDLCTAGGLDAAAYVRALHELYGRQFRARAPPNRPR